MSRADPILEVANLAVHFPVRGKGSKNIAIRAVEDVSFKIGRGETLGLVGESGCGKSTVSNAVVGLLAPTRGSIRITSVEMVGANRKTIFELRRRAQMIFQDPALSLNPRMTVGAAIGEPLTVRRLVRGGALAERVSQLLTSVGLKPEDARRYPHQFSGGQRQRVVIARALAVAPAILVCDEPVSALDVSVRAQILNLLVELQHRRGVAYLFVSHDLAVVRHICDRIAVMYLGRLVEVAERETLYANPRHPYTKALMSAVPEPDPELQRKKQRMILSGELPSPSNIPLGCAFHTRCPFATDLCRRERPPLEPRDDGTLVACHYA